MTHLLALVVSPAFLFPVEASDSESEPEEEEVESDSELDSEEESSLAQNFDIVGKLWGKREGG